MEAYEFKPLSEVEQMAEPGATTTALVIDGGEVKQLPVAAIGGGGSAVGGSAVGGSFIVNITVVADSEGAISSVTGDKTYDEISAAVSSGVIPVALIHGHMMFEVAHGVWIGKMNGDYAAHIFAVRVGDISVQVMVGPDNAWGAL